MIQHVFNYSDYFYVDLSTIHGKGLFTSIDIPANSIILYVGDFKGAQTKDWISEKGKMVNHAEPGNCHVQRINTQFFMYSSVDIEAGQELTSDYTKLSYPFKNYVEGVTNKKQ